MCFEVVFIAISSFLSVNIMSSTYHEFSHLVSLTSDVSVAPCLLFSSFSFTGLFLITVSNSNVKFEIRSRLVKELVS